MTREEILLKYHAIQGTALNEIKEIINTRTPQCEADLLKMLADIETVADFASGVDLDNPHYDGLAIVEAMAFEPGMDILSQAARGAGG